MKIWCVLFVVCLYACTSSYKGVPKTYYPLLDAAFSKAGNHAAELKKALQNSPSGQKEGMAFLIAYMPERDLKSLSASFLLENVAYAYRARERFAWAKELPDSVFLMKYCRMYR
ncbi:MAG: hypothetical protein K2I47_04015 [Odoribacter sp.]|nr:hypothetical protein [Odoribacter sp.]